MRQSGLLVSAVMGLCFLVSFTSAGVLDSLSKKKITSLKSTSAYREWPSLSTVVSTADGTQLIVDMCEANIIVPLTSQRIAKRNFTVKSTHFPFRRSNPLLCSWNVKASKSCRRGLITMTINERSRLAGGEGCLNGYYTVSPFMDDVKICGRVSFVPALQWYVEDQQPEVTINLKHVGLNDGFSQGLAFTVSGECLPDASDMTKSKAAQSYKHWLQQLATQSLSNGVPTVVLPDGLRLESLLADSLPTSTTPPKRKAVPTKRPAKPVAFTDQFNLETPWHVLKNQSLLALHRPAKNNAKSPASQMVDLIVWT